VAVLDRFALSGRTAVVTGSTRGLGRAFALALAEAGASVVVVGRDPQAAAGVEAELAERGARSRTVLADVTVRSDVEGVLAAAVETFGRVDVLVNNAGTCVHKPALEVTDAEWRHVMGTNVDGLWLTSQVFGGHMVEQGGGTIVNIGSMSAAIVNRPQWQPAYNASKAAVHHLTRSLAAEWAPLGVRVNALAPGYMKTEMSPVDEPRYRRHWIDDSPMQRYGTPDELGPAVVFLASDASSFMTGSVLTVDGGYSVF
jgi:NAD(P)-dependent dehydrogenase (short-subunit alcohol dehydrogenase family)